jgi:hypothetical protein
MCKDLNSNLSVKIFSAHWIGGKVGRTTGPYTVVAKIEFLSLTGIDPQSCCVLQLTSLIGVSWFQKPEPE